MLDMQYCRAMRRDQRSRRPSKWNKFNFGKHLAPHFMHLSIEFNPSQVSRAVQVSTEKSKIFYFRDVCQDLLNRADTEAKRGYKI